MEVTKFANMADENTPVQFVTETRSVNMDVSDTCAPTVAVVKSVSMVE